MSAQEQADIGDHIAELEWTVAQTAWNQYDKERAAINREFTVRSIALKGADDTLLRLEMSLAIKAHEATAPSMPRPDGRPGRARELHAVPDYHTGYRSYWGE